MEFCSAFPYDGPVKSNLLLIALLVISSVTSFADETPETPYIPVGPGKERKTVLAFPKIVAPSSNGLPTQAEKIQQIVTGDLTFMEQYQFLPEAAFIEPQEGGMRAGIRPDAFKFAHWKGIGADVLLKAELTGSANQLSLEAYAYELSSGKQLVSKRYLAKPEDLKIMAHQYANDITQALTGLPGLFLTKIVMSCDRTNKKEIYVMAFDGTDVKQVTHHRSTAFAPAWSPDGLKIAYSLYTRHTDNNKNLDLFEFDFATSTVRLLSNRKGLNSGASYSPDGKKVALTMSFLGNPEVFVLDRASGQAMRMTQSLGFDVDPVFSPDGQDLAFVSTRAGSSMVYRMKADGSSPTRLTYAGTYNATPTWARSGKKIAFAGWLHGKFDIFLMNPDGTQIERLTNEGNNEDPHFSPDGNFIVFSSNRTGTKQIYLMNTSGNFVKRLTYGLGNCTGPKWSNPPK